jgi:hypothetical protein
MLLDGVEESPEFKDDFYRECYVPLIVVHGPALRSAQEKLSAHIFELLDLRAAAATMRL